MRQVWDRLADLPAVPHPPEAVAAVLVPLYDDGSGEIRLILTKRPDSMRTHPGDVVFPGGRMEPGEDPVRAAVREAREEVGLQEISILEIFGGLNPVTTRDKDAPIIPVVARVQRPVTLYPDPREVEAIIEPKLSELLDDALWRRSEWYGRTVWFYEFAEGTLWGATALMVRQLLAIVR
jgi:8-oxo-dGTP pyrophosphatase MutT (NUDIX family)